MEADAPPHARRAKAGLERTARREAAKPTKRLAQNLRPQNYQFAIINSHFKKITTFAALYSNFFRSYHCT
jgi:hypothetical protein